MELALTWLASLTKRAQKSFYWVKYEFSNSFDSPMLAPFPHHDILCRCGTAYSEFCEYKENSMICQEPMHLSWGQRVETPLKQDKKLHSSRTKGQKDMARWFYITRCLVHIMNFIQSKFSLSSPKKQCNKEHRANSQTLGIPHNRLTLGLEF